MTIVVTKTSAANAVVTLTGKAAAHANADDIANLAVSFHDTAFAMGGAAAVTGSSVSDLGVDFYDPSRTWYVSQWGTNGAPCDGSLEKPWATIAYAIAQATLGDTVHVLAGTLTESGISVPKLLIIDGDGAGTTIVQAAATRKSAATRVFTVSADATIRNLTIRHGHNQAYGSAVHATDVNLRLEDCTIADNDATGAVPWNGGAVCVQSENGSGSLTMVGCEATGNVSAGSGGAVFAGGSVPPPMVVSNCTIRGNRAAYHGGGISGSVGIQVHSSVIVNNMSGTDGGGVRGNGGILDSTIAGNVCTNFGGGLAFSGTIVNSTVFGNTALAADRAYLHGGGGISCGSALTIRNSTIVSNVCLNWYGGGVIQDGNAAALDIESTIVAGNSGLTGPDYYRNGSGAFAERFNLVGNNANSPFAAGVTNANGSVVGTDADSVDPMLNALADNGGPTMTCALLPGSPAINAGSNPLGLPFDQRGAKFSRVAKDRADIGAFEFRMASGTVFILR